MGLSSSIPTVPVPSLPKSVLQNNIGALMLFKGSSIPLAKERFYASLTATATTTVSTSTSTSTSGVDIHVTGTDTAANNDNDENEDTSTSLASKIKELNLFHESSSSNSNSNSNNNKIHNVDVQGLTWFHNKLLREVVNSTGGGNGSSNSGSGNGSSSNLNSGVGSGSSSSSITGGSNRNIASSFTKARSFSLSSSSKTASTSTSTSMRRLSMGQEKIEEDDDDDDLFLYHNHHQNNHGNGSSNSTPNHHNVKNHSHSHSYNHVQNHVQNHVHIHHNHHDNHVNEDIPLGLEYVHDPICLLSNHNNNSNSNHSHNSNHNMNSNHSHDQGNKQQQHNCEMNVQIAAGINLALCIWSSNEEYYNIRNNMKAKLDINVDVDSDVDADVEAKDNDNGNNSSNSNSSNLVWCRNRIRNKKAKSALSILRLVLEYINEQKEKGKQEQQIHDENDNGNENDENNNDMKLCYSCQQKKKIEKIQSLREQTKRSTSWAKVCTPPRLQEEKEEDDDIDENMNDNMNDNDKNQGESTKTPSLSCCPDPLLLVIVHNNIGVLYFILNKVKQALHHFEQAKSIVLSIQERDEIQQEQQHQQQGQQMNSNSGRGYPYRPSNHSFMNDNHQSMRRSSTSTNGIIPMRTQLLKSTKYRSSSHSSYLPISATTSSSTSKQNQKQCHNLLPSFEYLHLTTILNLTRTAIRINGMIEHAKTLSTELQDLVLSITSNNSSLQLSSSSKSFKQYQQRRQSLSSSLSSSSKCLQQHHHHNTLSLSHNTTLKSFQEQHRIKWLITISTNYIPGLLQQRLEHHTQSIEYYNSMLSYTRKELGHDHIYAATILEKKGNVLFHQRKCQTAMLSYLASLRIYEHQPVPLPFESLLSSLSQQQRRQEQHFQHQHQHQHQHQQKQNENENILINNGYQLDQSKLLYAIGRTLHDREEFADALSMYKKALSLLQLEDSVPHIDDRQDRATLLESIQIMCNIGRIHQIMGELELSLEVNLKIVSMASEMVGSGSNTVNIGDNSSTSSDQILHPFVRNRLVVVGNVYVEMGRLDDAMIVFSRVARRSGEGGIDWMVGHLRPEVEDVDTSAFAVRAAERLGELGARTLCAHAAAA
jgi:tetratricopeptide (TPR) repeat protein